MYTWRVTQVGSEATQALLFMLVLASALKCGGFVVRRGAQNEIEITC